jgi:hypothetical protein
MMMVDGVIDSVLIACSAYGRVADWGLVAVGSDMINLWRNKPMTKLHSTVAVC